MILRRRPDLPEELAGAWAAFADCAGVVEGGRRTLLSTLPTGRVEPAPVGVGLDAVAAAIDDARGWMGAWRDVGLDGAWRDCAGALAEAEAAIEEARHVAATTGELEDLLGAVEDVVAPLDAFADAERLWRRTWRVPRGRGA